MYNEEQSARRFYAVSYNDDEPTISLGRLIPKRPKHRPLRIAFAPKAVSQSKVESGVPTPYATVRVVTIIFSLLLLLLVGVTSLPMIKSAGSTLTAQLFSSAEVPTSVVIQNPYTATETPLNYGVQIAFTEPGFFDQTREAFINESKTFLEVDLTSMQLRYFKAGVLTEQMPILAKGKKGSWWETPAGLYEIKSKSKTHFSSFGQVNTPWNLAFQGNFFIHGWPTNLDGTPVAADYAGGCIRLSDADAEKMYTIVGENTAVLVHEGPFESDGFVYEPKIPELDTPHYLIADVESSTVLASSELGDIASIASLTKLMTALVAAENINLDTSISVTQPTFVQSLIPRLRDSTKVSMYSLLQLLLVESSNEAAQVIADEIGREEFVVLMNQKAETLGLTGTHFADPAGLSADNTSNLRDLLGLTQYIYNNRQFIIELTADQNLPTAYVSGEFGTLSNFNKVAGLDNFIGGKVGETHAAGQTSITLHKLKVKGVERVIAVILLGSDSRNADVKELLGYAEARFGY